MKNINVTINFDVKKFNALLESATEFFMQMESESIHDVDIEKCLSDYASALLTYNQTLIKSSI